MSSSDDVSVFANTSDFPEVKHVPVRALRRTSFFSIHTFPAGLFLHKQRLSAYDIQHAQGFCGGSPNIVTAHICLGKYLESLQNVPWTTRTSLKLSASRERNFYRNYEGAVIVLSQRMRQEFLEQYDSRSEIIVIPHGVDSERFHPRNRSQYRSEIRKSLGISDQETVGLYVGDLAKSHSVLQKLAVSSPNIRFCILTRSTGYRWSSTNTIFLNSDPQVEKYYAAADFFVYPTVYDSFGLTVLEAMASGLPVFASDRAGVSECMDHGINGFVFRLDQWIDGVLTNSMKQDLLARIGSQAAEKARQYSWQEVVRKTRDVYSRVLKQC